MSDRSPPAATVYELADNLTKLWCYAERNWCGAVPNETSVPEVVDVHVGRVRQLTGDLVQDKICVALAKSLQSVTGAAWEQYQSEWQSAEHRKALRDPDQAIEPEFAYEHEQALLRLSPLAGRAWAALKQVTRKLRVALPLALRNCFKLSALLAGELYPTDERDRRLERMRMTDLRYLTVTVNRKLRQLLNKLAQDFPQLEGLDCDISGETETGARKKLGRLHQAILRRLKASPAGKQTAATTDGSVDSVRPPTNSDHALPGLAATDGQARTEMKVEPEELKRLLQIKREIDPQGHYVGESLAILRVFELIEQYNRQPDKPILILGSTGSGKTEIAEVIHRHSARKEKRFHREQASDNRASDMSIVKGRWVGFGKNPGLHGIPPGGQPGLVQDCAGGTIFLDELAEVSLDVQTFLLDILDAKEIPPTAGQGASIKPNVRLLCATNANIEDAVRTGKLKRDLVRRLRPYTLTIPPLNDRKEDILLFVAGHCAERRPSPGFLLCLLRYDWPGNVGELLDTLKKVHAQTAEKQPLLVDHLDVNDPTFAAIVKAVRLMPLESVEKEVYGFLADWLQRQGLTKRKGLYQKMAGFLGLSEATVSRKAKTYLSDLSSRP